MRRFVCPRCDNEVYFDSLACVNCDTGLILDPTAERFLALGGESAAPCSNREETGCNWVAMDGLDRCIACAHNRTIPDLSNDANRTSFRRIDLARRQLFYAILKWRLPHPLVAGGPHAPLIFDFLADDPDSGRPVLTGHAGGVITLNIAEGDDAERERRRTAMNEPYRTLVGHMRHEIGHYYWEVLVRDDHHLDRFRELFGDEREDYGLALQRHYEQGPPAGWTSRFISSYASSHPWEDFAESWAHYLHMVDTLETAFAYGLQWRAGRPQEDGLRAAALAFPTYGAVLDIDFNAYHTRDWTGLRDAWLPLTLALNALNRSIGQPDLYPFAPPPPALEKLGFVHNLLHGQSP